MFNEKKSNKLRNIILVTVIFYVLLGAAFLAWRWREKIKAKSNATIITQNAVCATPVASAASPEVLPETAEPAAENNSDNSADNLTNNPADTSVGGIGCLHQNISTTYFWVGEDAGKDNHNISNTPSAWDDIWMTHFGGVDDPKKRNGYMPASFTPKENPFYFALPYNDFNSQGNHKKEIASLIPWVGNAKVGDLQSVCKNRWIKITKGNNVAYAQWEDVGPFKEDDNSYVFGSASPKSKTNDHAGLDVSPAVHDYLGLSDVDKTSWQFVDASAVPDGPWKKIITTSQVYWN